MSTTRMSLLGCVMVAVCLRLATPAFADVVTDWNAIAVTATNTASRPAPAWILDVAMVQLAVHDAIQAYQRRFESYNTPVEHASGSPVVAAATAARDVLVNRFPSQEGSIQTTYLNYLSANGLSVTDVGVAVGQLAALRIIAHRAHDGSYPANPEVFTGGTAPGQWRPTQPGFNVPMAAPWFGDVMPFALRRQDLLPEPLPPSLHSAEYARDYNEVKLFGARTNSLRSQEQSDLATFYSGNFLTQMNGVLRDVAHRYLSDIGDSARLLALANVAAADALISTWHNKRHYNTWRPSTAIVEGNNDGNDHTDGDPTWLPFFNEPPYPDYSSGANAFTGAVMRALWRFFGEDVLTFTITSTAAGVHPRTYTRFSDVSHDVVEARILMGIHFRFADTVARRQGFQSADWAVDHILRPAH
jgi:hypothetical protein